MLASLLRFALHNRMAAVLLAASIGIGGYYAFTQLTVEAFPDPTDVQVQVITLYPGQPAEEVERRVSIPLERALNGTPALYRLRSISLFGLSFLTLTFNDGAEPLRARQEVFQRFADADLPDGIKPGLGPMSTPIGEVYRYTLRGPGADPMSLRTLQDWTVRPRLLQTQGVADVVDYGGLVREIHVEPDPTLMAALGVQLTDIFAALKKASSNATGGYLEKGAQGFVIRSLGIFNSVDDIRQVRVAFHGGVPVTLKDVAHVAEGYEPRQGVVTRDDDEDAVEGIVLMRLGENPSVVLQNLAKTVHDLNTHGLPSGVRLESFYDRTELVHTTLATVFKNLAEGAALVIGVLFVFMLSLNASLIVALVIPLSLAASFLFLYLRGMSANLLSMGAVDFGIIVDGAVILVEHLYGHLAGSGHPETLRERVWKTAQEVARPTLFSLLIIIAAYLPIFALQRVEGRMFAPMAFTVVSALVGALLMTFTIVPVLALVALRRAKTPRESPLLRWARRIYEPTLGFAMENPAIVTVLATGALVAALVLAPRLGSEFLPELNEGALYVTFTLPPNYSLSEGRKITPQLKRLIQRTPEVTSVLSQLGRPEDGTDAKLPNNLEIFIRLKPMKAWRPEMHSLDDVVAEMDKNLREVPGIEYNFSQPIRDNVLENISGQQGQVALKIYGEDLQELQTIAETAKLALSKVPGVADLAIVRSATMPQLAVKLDRPALARFNLDLDDVQDYLETAMGGHVASELWDGEKRFDVTVRMPLAARSSAGTIRHMLLPVKDGLIPVDAVAQVGMSVGRAAITRENGRRYVGLRMNVRNRDLGSFVGEAQTVFEQSVQRPAGYDVTWGGEFENQQRAMRRLQLVIPLALLITFFLLFSAFGRASDALIILVNVPFGLVGGVVALGLAHMTLSVAAAVGFIALLGQAVLNGVLVVAAIKARLAAGQDALVAAVGGARDRLRAVLMTALLACLGLVPAALSHAPGSETQRPIAVVVVGGTITAAALTLVLLPMSYFWLHRLADRILRRVGARLPEPG